MNGDGNECEPSMSTRSSSVGSSLGRATSDFSTWNSRFSVEIPCAAQYARMRSTSSCEGTTLVCRAIVVAGLLLLLSGCGGKDPSPSPSVSVPKPATMRADDFVESVGVNVHLGYADTPYGRQDIVKAKLLELGVRYIRDGLTPRKPAVYRAWRELASRGIRLDLIAGDPLRRGGIGPIQDQLAIVKGELSHAVASLEGPNEYDIQG